MSDPILRDVEVRVWHQNTAESTDPDTILGPDVLTNITTESRSADVADEATIDLVDRDNNATDLRMGDRVEVYSLLGERGVGFGTSYGTEYGGPTETTRTLRAKSPKVSEGHPGVNGTRISTNATDWIAGIIGKRNITGHWLGEDIGAIIRDIVERKASEVDASNVPDLGVTTDIRCQNDNAWDTIVSLAARADAITLQQGTELHVTPISGLERAFDLTTDDWRYPFDVDTDDKVKNVIRVDSGTGRREESVQETTSSWVTVTQSSRETHRLRARKSAIHSVDLYVRKVSDERLKIRLQADEGGAPVAIEDEDSNIDTAAWPADELPSEGWQAFFFDDHVLPDRDPWLIIETEGDTGHDIAVDGSGVPAHRSYYPHPLAFEDTDQDSIDEYGPREHQVDRDGLDTTVAVQDAVRGELAKLAWPEKTVTFPAASPRAHALEPGQIIGVDKPDENAVGDFIVTEVARTLDSDTATVSTDITATWRKGVRAPQ